MEDWVKVSWTLKQNKLIKFNFFYRFLSKCSLTRESFGPEENKVS